MKVEPVFVVVSYVPVTHLSVSEGVVRGVRGVDVGGADSRSTGRSFVGEGFVRSGTCAEEYGVEVFVRWVKGRSRSTGCSDSCV
jgi:hypothetical protein